MPGSQTAENVSARVCTIFKQQKPLQVHSLWSLHMACYPAWKKCKECFWEEQSIWQVSQSRDGGIPVGRGSVLLLRFPCGTKTNHAGDELSWYPSRSLPGSHPCLFWTAQSVWCMAWTIRFRLWTLEILFLCDTRSRMKDDGKEWKAVYSTAYCTSPLGDVLVNPHKCHSIIQPCFLRHLPNPFISLLTQRRIVKTVVWGLFVP